MFPRWLPLYLLGIAALTLFPFAAPECAPRGWVIRWDTFDFTANFLAFLPIGIALHRWPRSGALLLAFALSLTIEICQHWLPRLQDFSDLVSNTIGAGVGHVLGQAWATRWSGPLLRPVTRQAVLLIASPLLLIAAAVESGSTRANDFSNWQPFPLTIGNSSYGDRPWMGEVADVAIYDRALGAGETVPSDADPGSPALWGEGGPILWLRFDEEPTGRIDGPGGPVRYSPELLPDDPTSTSGLRLVPSGVTLDGWVSDHVVEQLRASGQLTLDVGLRASVLYQHGPARIVALGDGGRFRDFMLSQLSSGLVARIRTPANGLGGTNSELQTRNGVVTQKPQNIRLTYDGSNAILRVDGRCEDSTYLSLANANSILGPFLGVTIVLSTALAALACASFARATRWRFVLGALGALAAWSLLSSAGAWDHLPEFSPEATWLAALAFLASMPMLRQYR